MAKRKLLDEFGDDTNSTEEFSDFMDIDSDDGVQPEDYEEIDDSESLPSTSDMSWSPTDNSATFFEGVDKTDDSKLLTDDSLTDVDADTDSSSDTFFEGEEGEEENGTKALFKKLFGDDTDDEGVSEEGNKDDESLRDCRSASENEDDDETDEDQPLVSNLSEYYVVDDTEDDVDKSLDESPKENDESEFHMVFKKLRLDR